MSDVARVPQRQSDPDDLAGLAMAQFPSRLNASDTLLWTIETDPSLRTTIVAVLVLDRSPDWERFRSRMLEASELVPRLRQRVVAEPMRLGPPRWQLEENFDLDFHLRRVCAPPPGDLRSVLDIAGHIAMDAFDKDRPLWEFTVVEGMAGGQAALIQKVHHCMTDGVGGMKLVQLLLDDSRRSTRSKTAGPAASRRHSAPPVSVAQVLADDLRKVATMSAHGARAVPGVAAKVVTDPLGLWNSTARGARSVAKLLAPVTEPLSPIMRQRGLSRRLDSFDVSIDDLRAAAHGADSSLNDAFLAGIAGGMRRYHEQHEAPVASLRVTMPINLRRPTDPPGSNRFSPARFVMPVSTADPRERMRELGELARTWRKEPALPLTAMIAGALNRLPEVATTSIFGSMLKAIDFVATNVPGLPKRAYLAGAEVVAEYAFAPTSGAAFSVALLSHVDKCCIGINCDTSAVTDPKVLTRCLREGFDEVLASARSAP